MRHPSRMDDQFTDDELLAEMFGDIAFDALTKIGSDPEARYQFFRAFIDLSRRAVERQQN
jgi:hypothetical protein